MRYRLIALCSAVLSALALVLHCSKRRRSQERRQGALSADRLSGRHAASGIDVIDQSQAAELRAPARAAGPVGRRRAGRLDRDPDRRRPAGRGGAACDQCQRVARAAPRRAQGRSDRHHQPDRERARGGATNASLPVAVTLATDLPAKLTLTPQLPELRGTSKSNFEFQLAIKNESGKKVVVSLSATGSAEFRCDLYRAVRQPGAQCAPARSRPVEGRQAQGAAAEHGRRRQVQGDGEGDRRRRDRDRRARPSTSPASPRSTSPAAKACSAPRPRPARKTSIPVILTNSGTAPAEQIELSGTAPHGLEGQFRAQDRRSHRAERNQGSAGAGHAAPTRPWPATTSPPSALRRAASRPRSPSASRSRPRRCGASSVSPSSAVRCWS